MAPATFLKFKKPLTIAVGVAALGVLYVTGGRHYLKTKEMERFEAEAKEIWRLRQARQQQEMFDSEKE